MVQLCFWFWSRYIGFGLGSDLLLLVRGLVHQVLVLTLFLILSLDWVFDHLWFQFRILGPFLVPIFRLVLNPTFILVFVSCSGAGFFFFFVSGSGSCP